jgi:hypothetical protein
MNLPVATSNEQAIPDMQLKSAHPAESRLHPPAPATRALRSTPKTGEGEQEFLKVPLPLWERDLG